MAKKGLYKEVDNDVQVKYSYHNDWKISLAVHTLLMVLTISLSRCFSLTYRQTAVIAISASTILLNFLPINSYRSVSMTKSIGLEVTSTTGVIFKSTSHKLVPTADIIDVVILEGFKGLEVIYYLACIVNKENKLTLILPDVSLSLSSLNEIRKSIKQLV